MISEHNPIAKALAGHAFRADALHRNNQGIRKKAEAYDNPLTDFVNLVIAEVKAKKNIADSHNAGSAQASIGTATDG